MTSPTAQKSMPPPRKVRWRRVVVAQALVLVGGLLLAEIGTRIWLRAQDDPFEPEVARGMIASLVSRAAELVPNVPRDEAPLPLEEAVQVPVLHPFTGYLVTGMVRQIDHDLEASRAAAGEDRYEILVVGGSVAAVFGAVGEKHFVARLAADPLFAGRKLHVYEYGMGGFKQPQIVNLVQYFLALGLEPECVIDIDGFNEVALGNANAVAGANPLLPSFAHWESLTNVAAPDRETVGAAYAGLEEQEGIVSLGERALAFGAHRSALASNLVLDALRTREARAQAAFASYSDRLRERSSDLVRRGPAFTAGAQAAAEASVRCWEESSLTLRALCDARGILYLHVLQPTLHDPGSKVLTPKEIANGHALDSWIEGVRAGYPLLRAAGERLRAGGEHFIDATQLFADVPGRIYFDACHFGEEGNRLLADRIAEKLLECERKRR